MNTAGMEEEWDGLKQRLHITWVESTPQVLHGLSGNAELITENEALQMTREQVDRAVGILKVITRN